MYSLAERMTRLLRVLCGVLLLLTVLSAPARAEEHDRGSKVVRVGYYYEKNFSEGRNDKELKQGYAYEYYQLLARYTGWRYDYVYDSYDVLYQKLLNGEIDLLAGLGYLPEREALMSYPELPMGNEYYTLVRRSDDGRLINGLSSVQGMTVGVLEGAIAKHTEKFAAENNLQLTIKTFKRMEDRDEALRSGLVDITAAEDSIGNYEGTEAFYHMGHTDFYLVVNKRRPDLLNDLNDAQQHLNYDHANILATLRDKYLRRTTFRTSLSDSERDWIAEHGMLIIGYVDNALPLSGTNADGQVIGLVSSFTRQMLAELRLTDSLPVSYRAYATPQKLFAALATHQVDVAFPVDDDIWMAEKFKLYPSDKFFSLPMNIIYKRGEHPQQVNTVAVFSGSKYQQTLAQLYYPQAKLLICDTPQGCPDAVLSGQADITVMNGYLTAALLGEHRYSSLQYSFLATRSFGLGVAAGNTRLLALLNRGIGLVSPDYAQSILQQYDYQQPQTVKDFLYEHVLLVIGIVGLIALLCLVIAFIYVQASRKDREMTGRLELALQNAQSANRAKTAFLSSISHDIRTPMNAIVGFTALAQHQLEDKSAVADYLRKIETSSHHLLELINDVLDMSRIESGKVQLEEGEVCFYQLLNGLQSILASDMQAKQLNFTITNNAQHNHVLTDRLRLNQILLNLLSNALKYTPPGGSISLTLEEEPGPGPDRSLYELHIKDTGIGMSEEFQQHIFEAFTRERTATISGIQGTGLGMAITRQLVDLMGGHIRVNSKLHVGTEFIVSLNLRYGTELEEQQPVDTTALDLHGIKLLLVEDNELNQEIATMLLEEAGATVTVAEDGDIAVARLSSAVPGEFDVVLMDIQMPRMDGFTATREIRTLHDSAVSNIPIIAMTANAFEEDRKKAFAAGMNGFCTKPIEPEEIVRTVHMLLNK